MSGQICRQFGASAVAVEYGSAPMLMGPQRGWPGCLPAVWRTRCPRGAWTKQSELRSATS